MPQAQRHLVDRALQRDRAGRFAGRAHEQRRAGVEPHRLMRGRDRRTGIERVRGVGRPARRNRRTCWWRSWRDGRSRSARRRGRRRGAAVCRVGERWPTGPYICSRRSTSLTGRPTSRAAMMPSTCGPRDQALRAEAAAEERAADVDVLRRDAEQPGDARPAPSPGPGSACRSTACRRPRPRRWRAAPSHCGTAPAFRRSPRCASMPPPSPASTSPCCTSAGLPTPTAGGTKLSSASRPTRAGSRLVARRQQRGAFGRRLQRLGDHHRDRLVGVAHPIVLQQVEPEHERVGLGVRVLRQRRACSPAS